VKCPDGYSWVDNRCKECHCTFVDLQVLGQNNTSTTSTISGGIQYRCKENFQLTQNSEGRYVCICPPPFTLNRAAETCS
jgi:hypothetical protein